MRTPDNHTFHTRKCDFLSLAAPGEDSPVQAQLVAALVWRRAKEQELANKLLTLSKGHGEPKVQKLLQKQN